MSGLAQAEGPLDQVADEADVVIRVRAFDATVEKVAALAEAVQPGAGALASGNATAFGLLLSNPAMAGVDQSQDFYLVLFARSEGEPQALFIVPASDAAAMQKALPANFESQVRDGWVFYADKTHGVPAAASASDSVGQALSESDAGDLFDRADIGLHVNVEHLSTVYSDKIAEGRVKFEEAMDQGKNTPGVNAAGAVEVLKLEADLAFLVLEETTSFTLGLNASEEGLEIESLVDLDEAGDVAAFLKKQPLSKFDGMSRLVGDAPVYMGMSANFSEFAPFFAKAMSSLYADEAIGQAMQDAMEVWVQSQTSTLSGSFDLASGDGLLRSSYFAETSQSAQLIEASRQMGAAMKSIDLGGVKQEVTYEKDAETIGSHKIDVMTTKQTFDPNQQGAQIQAMISTVMFGENGMQNRVTGLSDGTLQVLGGGKEAMEAALQAYEAKSNSLDSVREGMPAEAHGLLLLDLPGLVNNGLLAATMIPGIPPLPFTRESVEGLMIERSYSATSVVGEEHAVRVTSQIPVEQFQGVVKLVYLIRGIR